MPEYHSQSGQDKFLEEIIFKGFKNGFYMDIGAHDGISINNTLYFNRVHGWKGVNVEPIKSVFDNLVINRPDDINLNCAISDTEGLQEFLCNTGYTEMLSGLKNMYDQRHFQRLIKENISNGGKTNTIMVDAKRIESVCDKHTIHHIHYLSIDVEGAELSVIKSINFDKVFIDVIQFENNYNDHTCDEIISYLSNKNYTLIKRSTDVFMIHNNSEFKGGQRHMN
jgi:FkbM family methyltransferase